MRKPAVVTSVAIHTTAIALLFLATFPQPAIVLRLAEGVRIVPLHYTPRPVAKEGGGGQREKLPVSRGSPPIARPRRIWIPPTVVRNEAPRLIVEQALLEPPDIGIQTPLIGDPQGKPGLLGGGAGDKGGLGNGRRGGIGDGEGPRLGGDSSRDVNRSRARITRGPQLIYKEEPEYTEEARKARFQGTVLLSIEVDVNGRAINIRVLRSLGLGLDERAIAAVERWRFRPAISGDAPVSAPATVEVNFRLL